MWGFWWVMPLVGVVLVMVFLITMIRMIRSGHGPMCIGGHDNGSRDELGALRREIRELREELRRQRAS